MWCNVKPSLIQRARKTPLLAIRLLQLLFVTSPSQQLLLDIAFVTIDAIVRPRFTMTYIDPRAAPDSNTTVILKPASYEHAFTLTGPNPTGIPEEFKNNEGEYIMVVLDPAGETLSSLTSNLEPTAMTSTSTQATSTQTTPTQVSTTERESTKTNDSNPKETEGADDSTTSEKTISPAEAGGIAAGAAMAGVLLSALIAICYFWSRKRRQDKRAFVPPPMAKKDVVHRQLDVLDHLPQRTADESIRQKLEKLQTDIKNCVDNLFHTDNTIQLDDSAETSFQSLAGSPIDSSSWSAALLKDELRPRVIRALIARILFASIDPLCVPETSLLSPELVVVHRSLQAGPEKSKRDIDLKLGKPERTS